MNSMKPLAMAALTVAAASAGGAFAAFMSLPAGWLTGAMLVTAAMVIGGAPLTMPDRVRQVIFVLLGLSMGAAFTPETIATMFKWPASLAGLFVAMIGIIAACVVFLRKFAGWDRPTAFFASVPGAMSYVLALSLRSSADTRLVVVAQMLRLLVLMALLPIAVRATMPMELPAPPPAGDALLGPGIGLAVQIACGFALGYLCEWLKVPAGLMVGAMFAGAALHLSGTVSGTMPPAILIPSQVLLGAFIGLRFSGSDAKLLRAAALPSIGSFVIAIAVTALVAAAVSYGLALPMGQVLVAFAPGGLEAMTILAFVLGVDPAYVGVHQLARFLGLSLLLPFIVRFYLRKRADS
jgi:membrane AbrB-like protein